MIGLTLRVTRLPGPCVERIFELQRGDSGQVSLDLTEHAYYWCLKDEARKSVAAAINARTGNAYDKVTLSSIDGEAIEKSRLEWPKYYGPNTHDGFSVSWERIFHKFLNRPSFFDLAVWQIVGGQRVLQGLAIGKPSKAKTRLSLNWIERSFAPTYLRAGVLLPILACAQEYAKLLGSSSVVIRDAVDPTKYERYGYERRQLKHIGDVLVKEL